MWFAFIVLLYLKKNTQNFCPRCFNPHFTNEETKELSNTQIPTDSK